MTALSDRRDQRAEAEAADARRAASGDEQAFERLYHAHAARIHSLARRLLGPDDADEATQDVFVRAWSKLEQFEGRSSFGTWLYRLAINVMLAGRATRGRWESRMRGGDELVQRHESRRWTPELRLDFEAAIARLPEGARRVFVLHDVEGFKHGEIGALLGVTEGTSKAQLHRARLMLRQYVER